MERTEQLEAEVRSLREKEPYAGIASEVLEEKNTLCENAVVGVGVPLTNEYLLPDVLKDDGGEKSEDDTDSTLLVGITYELQESIWDASLLFGTEELGVTATVWAVVLLLVNSAVQIILAIVVIQQLTDPTFPSDTIAALRTWRINIAHDIRCTFSGFLSDVMKCALQEHGPAHISIPCCACVRWGCWA